MTAGERVIAETEAILARLTDAELARYSHAVWREEMEREARDAQAVMDAIPCQVLGREEIDPDTWRG